MSCAGCASRAVALYLADTSAWHWSGRVADRWSALLEADEIAICTPVALELLFSARSPSDYLGLADELDGLQWVASDDVSEAAALRTQDALARRGQHRGAAPMDVLIAALAEAHDLVLLHYDRHLDAVAQATGQRAEWLARRGSLR
jgi:predicted nucleic acid-binding protein